ncbi:restriction endonuclease subunit S [Moraxella sp. FZLJ2107]|uniref:restriction endonuclease subunit S n=1 Tax=unclassified Moraxella TaxID=2685852 RepID=UPI0020C8D2E4|nr:MULTISPECIES: restriction endonuclease subunit S [unclassified Moraxella]UTO06009.1 restriction endonuclease subunit S [Moraxella sp. FZLJ2107]UTO22746.1 restriction endonuclease subunit S [Moraxella sp. FZLJ2109]
MHPFLQQLLAGQAVEWKPLGEIAIVYGGLTGKKKADFEAGNAKYITYKNIFGNIEVKESILETVQIHDDERQHEVKYGDILFTGSSEIAEEAGMSSAVTTHFSEKVYLNSFSFGVRFHDDIEIMPEFAKFLFRSNFMRMQIAKTASGVTRFNISKEKFKRIKIPIPPLSVQTKIVQILDTMTAITAELTAELSMRNKQYQYYRDKLLSENELAKVGFEWKSLGEVINLKRGKRLVRSELEETGECAVYQNSLQPLGYYHQANCPSNSTFIITAGAAGEIGYSYTDFWAADDCYYLECPKDKLNDRFVYHALMNQKQKIVGQVRKASVPRLGRNSIENISIPIPPLAEQARIVAILDKFDTLTQSISDGLPREIELRQQQYEYYREMLLGFEA